MSQTETTVQQASISEEEKNRSATPTTNSSNNLTQVAPQQPIAQESTNKSKKGKKQVNPDHVKSPLPIQSTDNSNRANSTTSARGGPSTVKPYHKGGFLSLLLCCTVGSGSFLDHSDKSSSLSKKSPSSTKNPKLVDQKGKQQSSSSIHSSSSHNGVQIITAERQPEQPVVAVEQREPEIPPAIITNPNQLRKLSSSADPSLTNEGTLKNDNHPDEDESNSPILFSPQISPNGPVVWLLPSLTEEDKSRKCLVLDLDETLVHSSFKIIPNPDFIVPVEIDNQYHNVYVLKRPGVDEFMRRMGEMYEIVVFTASLAKYADPVLDMLDVHKVVKHRLFRESCFNHKGTYVKDLSQLGRDLASTLILDNSPASYIFHTSNAVPVSTWFNDPHDTELTDLVAFLEDLTVVEDVQLVLDNIIDPNVNSITSTTA